MEAVKIDRISELPVFILHKILSRLPRGDSGRTSALSKRWNSVWNSFPIFEFRQNISMDRGEFLHSVDKSLRRFVESKYRMEKLDLCLRMESCDSVSMIDAWLPLALSNGVSDVSFSFFGDFYPLPETTFASSKPFSFLGTLKLSEVCLSEKIVGDICHNCPHITHLHLCYIGGHFKNIEISKLDRLESLDIGLSRIYEMESVSVDAKSLKSFSLCIPDDPPCALYLNSCLDLKQVSLINCAINDDLFHSYLCRFSLIEDLEINICHLLRRIRISLPRLKRLYLCLDGIEAIEIDAPNLSSFVYTGFGVLPLLFSDKAIPCHMSLFYTLYATDGQVDSFSFLKLREFLRVPTQGIHIGLSFRDGNVSFDPEELTEAVIPPVVEVDSLELSSSKTSHPLDCATLIDGILWSCHPKKIDISAAEDFGKNCIKVLCEKLLQSENRSCCNSTHFKCWRCSLKGAKVKIIGEIEFKKIKSVGGIEDKQLRYALNAVPLLRDGDVVRFTLAWDH